MSKSAPKKELEALHAALANTFKTILEEGETEVDKDGGIVKVTPKPATLNAIRQFLKDNGIESAEVPAKPAEKQLTAGLPYAGSPEDRDPDIPTYQ